MPQQRKLLNGDHIFHQQYGSGIVLRADLSYGVLVHFDNYGDMCVPLKTLSQIASRKLLIAKIIELFHSDFLSADVIFAADPDAALLNRDEYNDIKNRFVQSWAKRELDLSLDIEQAAAIASTNGNIQVIARAGSGKTRTLVTRAIFLQKHCQISPHELLLLAFNKKAAQEMKERLAQTLGDNLPHVMTFHALA